MTRDATLNTALLYYDHGKLAFRSQFAPILSAISIIPFFSISSIEHDSEFLKGHWESSPTVAKYTTKYMDLNDFMFTQPTSNYQGGLDVI